MKQVPVDANNIESGYRFNLHRDETMKNTSVLIKDAGNIRTLNYAVVVHDHLSCTKSAPQFCTIDTISNDVILNNNLACKFDMYANQDHMYANRSDNKNSTTSSSDPPISDAISSNKLRSNFDQNRQENRVCLLRKRHSRPSVDTTAKSVSECKSLESNVNNSTCILSQGTQHINANLPVLATRYFGRRSKTVPSRALKRRYLGPPKNLPVPREALVSTPPPVLVKEENEINHEESVNASAEDQNGNSSNSKVHKKRGRKPKKILLKRDYLTTDSTYLITDNWTLVDSCKSSPIDVPLWKSKPVPSFYQMEGTENINDPVFQRRHVKCELDERRRKRWDMQRLREQKVSQKLKYKAPKESGTDSNILINPKANSFYPNPLQIEYIEVTDMLPVLAFGCAIPLFQPCEFSLPWSHTKTEDSFTSSSYKGKKCRFSSNVSKVT